MDRWKRYVAAYAVLGLVISACSARADPPDQTAPTTEAIGPEATVVDGRSTIVRSDAGVTVEIPADGATGGTLTVHDASPADADPTANDLRDAGDPARITLTDGELTGDATITFPLGHVETGQFPILERLDDETGAWMPEPLENLAYEDGSVIVTVEHFSWYRPSWLSLDKLAERLRQLWFAVFGDGLAGGEPPTCPHDADTLGEFNWDSSSDDTLFWCVGTNDDGTRILNVVNNNRYPMALSTSSNMSDIFKWGGSWLTTANLGARIDEWGSGQVVLEGREGVTFSLDEGTEGTYRLRSDFTLFTWAFAMLGVALNAYVDIWTKAGATAQTVTRRMATAASSTACMGALVDKVLNDESMFGPARTMLVEAMGCAGEVFLDAISDYGLLARIGGSIVAFVTGPVIAAFEGLVAIGEIGYDSVRRRATYDLDLTPRTEQAPTAMGCQFDAPGVPLGHPDQFEAATRCLYQAWRNGDRAAAAIYADPPAIDALFSLPADGGAAWTYEGCRTGPDTYRSWGQTVCTYVEPPTSGEPHGVGIDFLFVAYDDVLVVGDIAFVG